MPLSAKHPPLTKPVGKINAAVVEDVVVVVVDEDVVVVDEEVVEEDVITAEVVEEDVVVAELLATVVELEDATTVESVVAEDKVEELEAAAEAYRIPPQTPLFERLPPRDDFM